MEQLFDFAKEAMKEPMITPEKYQELQKAIGDGDSKAYP